MRLSGDDWSRLGSRAETLAHFIGNRAYMRMSEGHCIALSLRAAPDGSTVYFCQHYDIRPAICRELERGSPECLGEIALKGDRPVSGFTPSAEGQPIPG